MTSFDAPPKQAFPTATALLMPASVKPGMTSTPRVEPVTRSDASDTYAQGQIPPRHQPGAAPSTTQDHSAPPSALQLKIRSILQKQAEALVEDAEEERTKPKQETTLNESELDAKQSSAAPPRRSEPETRASGAISQNLQGETSDPSDKTSSTA